MRVSWGVKYCKGKTNKEGKEDFAGQNLILLLSGIMGPLGQQRVETSSAATTCTMLRAKTRVNKPKRTAGATSSLPDPSSPSPQQDAQEHQGTQELTGGQQPSPGDSAHPP